MNQGFDFRRSFLSAGAVTRLIYINLAVFLTIKILGVIFFLMNKKELDDALIHLVALPADTGVLLKRPWTIFSYMFIHFDFLHILFNMLWLFWFGKIFLQYLDPRKLHAAYLLGGISGGALYILAYNLFPAFSENLGGAVALGASAAVLAIVMTISFYVPDYVLNLIFIGPVKLRYIALASIIIDILSIKSGNAGGHIAHLGGALFGIIFAGQLRRGKDLSRGFNRFLDGIASLFKPRPKIHVKYKRPVQSETDMEYNARKASEQRDIDRILDKISKNGYDALTKEEKNKLFSNSKK